MFLSESHNHIDGGVIHFQGGTHGFVEDVFCCTLLS